MSAAPTAGASRGTAPRSSLRTNLVIVLVLTVSFWGIFHQGLLVRSVFESLVREGLEPQVVQAVMRRVTLLGHGLTILALVVVVVLGTLLARRITRPIEGLTRAVRAIAAGDESAVVDVSGDDETGLLAREFAALLERRRAVEAALRASEEQFRTLAEESPSMILIVRGNGVAYANRACEETLGHPRSALGAPGFDLAAVFPAECVAAVHAVLRGEGGQGAAEPRECVLASGAGGRVEAVVTARRISFSGELAVLVIVTDVSEFKRAERERYELQAQLVQAQKLESIGRLAGGVAHDFNNILTAICGYADLALLRLPAGHEVRGQFQGILDAAERARGLTEQLLAFSRKQVVQPTTLDPREALERTVGMLRRMIEAGIELRLETEAAAGCVCIDPAQFNQVIVNLAVNARDAMPAGGRVTIALDGVTLPAGDARLGADMGPGGYVRLRVSDTGHGMPGEVRARVFEPFFTTKGPGRGTGLGLATVYGIVRQNGGGIEVESEPGRGTTFTVLLPRVPTATPPSTAAAAEPLPRGGELVLVAEDDPAVRDYLVAALGELGYEVLIAADGREALEALGKSGRAVDALVTDIVMPGMGGIELARALTAGGRTRLPIIFISGYSEDVAGVREFLDLGCPLLRKPLRVQDLARCLRAVLAARGATPSGTA